VTDETAEPAEPAAAAAASSTASAAEGAAAATAATAATSTDAEPVFCDQDPLRGAKLQYPVSFELRIIYLAALRDELQAQVAGIMRSYGISAGAPRLLPVSEKKYGRMAIQVEFIDESSMHGVYAAIGALPAVKAVM